MKQNFLGLLEVYSCPKRGELTPPPHMYVILYDFLKNAFIYAISFIPHCITGKKVLLKMLRAQATELKSGSSPQ